MQLKTILTKAVSMRFLLMIFLFVGSLCYADPFTTVTQTTVSVSVSAQALPANQVRTYLLIQNSGTDPVIVKIGSTIATTEGILIAAGGAYEPRLVPKQSVWLKATTGTQAVRILEGQ